MAASVYEMIASVVRNTLQSKRSEEGDDEHADLGRVTPFIMNTFGCGKAKTTVASDTDTQSSDSKFGGRLTICGFAIKGSIHSVVAVHDITCKSTDKECAKLSPCYGDSASSVHAHGPLDASRYARQLAMDYERPESALHRMLRDLWIAQSIHGCILLADYDTGREADNTTGPLAHAALVARFLMARLEELERA